MGNNLPMIKRLHANGIALTTAENSMALANVAIMGSHLSILQYLHGSGVGLFKAHEYRQGYFADTI